MRPAGCILYKTKLPLEAIVRRFVPPAGQLATIYMTEDRSGGADINVNAMSIGSKTAESGTVKAATVRANEQVGGRLGQCDC